jgi:hypothetical protein
MVLGLAGAVALTLIALLAGVILNNDDSSENVRASAVSTTTTTTEAPEVQPGVTSALQPTTTAKQGVVRAVNDTTPATAATTTTRPEAAPAAAPVCRNSFDARCGPFRWDPAPGPNEALTGKVQNDPEQATAGVPVNLKVLAEDPDSKIDRCAIVDWGDGTSSEPCPPPPSCQTPHGPWAPPARIKDTVEATFTHTYEQPGEYTPSFRYQSPITCEPNPYGGVATSFGHVSVTPAP